MAMLGKCLVFYFKYPAEMDRLYESLDSDEELELEGLSDQDRVLPMIERVGDTARREVAQFLEDCAKRIDPHFQSICFAQRRPTKLEKSLDLDWVLHETELLTFGFCAGVFIDFTLPGFVPYVWLKGGRKIEDDMVRALGRGEKASSSDLDMQYGTVALARVIAPIPSSPQNFDVEQEPLIEQITKALSLSSDDVKSLAGIAAKFQ